MLPKLTSEMCEAIDRNQKRPILVEDERTHLQYVLLPLASFRQVFGEDDFTVDDASAAQNLVAGLAGWDDPEMDVYDDYDANKGKR